jgi:hypothetical protein
MAKSTIIAAVEDNVIAATKTFKLLSGVECEIRKMLTKHQGVLTEQGGDVTEAFDTILADCIVLAGSKKLKTTRQAMLKKNTSMGSFLTTNI